jgi:hypothetical protein
VFGLFLSAKPRNFDGMLGTGLPVSMYTTKTPIEKCCFNVTQLKEFFTFSVKDRYQLNYFICIKDFNAETNTSLKLNLFSNRQATSGDYAITVTTSAYHSRRCSRL